ncbi:MAG: 3-phosphoshikimate 1-carboxyvinyltransferase [Haloquadratum sp. J07HQX50]|nr:MAG: 3-phosphoshikimate 1-carboxyvinyltransferase [Haloquadratum sp. J07HQX50]
MDVIVSESRLSGTVQAPPSKSYTHRAILAGGYSEQTTVHTPLRSADTRATMRAVEAFGGTVNDEGDDAVMIQGFNSNPTVPSSIIRCDNSGTTMRLTTACSALVDGLAVLTGDESLRSRPQGPLLEALSTLGATAVSTRENGQAPLVVGGGIDSNTVSIPGDVSSQFITALLMMSPATESGLSINLSTELKSAPYVDITTEVLSAFDIEVRKTEMGFTVPGGQSYRTPERGYTVPGDFSSISYLVAAGTVAGAVDGTLHIHNAQKSAQGDTAIFGILDRMGAAIEWDKSTATASVEPRPLTGTTVDVSDTPDLLPTVAAVGALADGTTIIENCEHVRYKETDRVSAMATELQKLGAHVTEHQDSLEIHGGKTTLAGGTVSGHGDHRVVMALTVAALGSGETTRISGAEHVDVSFPEFFTQLSRVGAVIEQQHESHK